MRVWMGVCSVLVMGALAWGDETATGSAFIGRPPTLAEEAVDQARIDTAEAYVACLTKTTSDTWFGAPDFAACDAARAAYAATLAAEVADDAVGCLEEGAVGKPRHPERTCAALHARFATSPVRRIESAR